MLALVVAALAEAPPGEPDIGQVAAAAVAGVTRFPGCARFEGEVRQTNRFAGLVSTYVHSWSAELTPEGWRPWRFSRVEGGDAGLMVSTDVSGVSYPFAVTLLGAMLPAGPGAAGAPEGDSMGAAPRELLLELLEAAGSAVELESVEVVRDAATPTLRYVRSLQTRRTLFGRRENLLQVELDAETTRPRRWTVSLADPVRFGDERIRRMELVLESDAEGWPIADRLDVTGALGPLALRVERAIAFRRTGPCGAGGP